MSHFRPSRQSYGWANRWWAPDAAEGLAMNTANRPADAKAQVEQKVQETKDEAMGLLTKIVIVAAVGGLVLTAGTSFAVYKAVT